MLHAKNYYNRPILHGAIQKIKVAGFFMDHGVVALLVWFKALSNIFLTKKHKGLILIYRQQHINLSAPKYNQHQIMLIKVPMWPKSITKKSINKMKSLLILYILQLRRIANHLHQLQLLRLFYNTCTVIYYTTPTVGLGPQSFLAAGASAWNSLPFELKNTSLTIGHLISQLKMAMFTKSYYASVQPS